MDQAPLAQRKPGSEASQDAVAPGQETTTEELLHFIARLTGNEPNARCRVGVGPLAPLAVALNELATGMDVRRSSSGEVFGLQALIEQSPNIMMAVGADERIRYVNFTVPGLSTEKTVGRDFADFADPSEVERSRSHVRRVLGTGEPLTYEIQTKAEVGARWYSVGVGPIRDHGRVVGVTMISTDITSLKETQFRLERSLRKLEQSNRELESFASVASHDLQEPLRKIQSFGERLKSAATTSLSPEALDYLERMQSAAGRMRKLIDDLLSFSRVTSKAQPFSKVNLATIARDVLSDLEVTIEQAVATVTVGELPVLEADPMQMRQLLQNLLTNALKFRRDNVAPHISVQASVDTQARRCELRVEDNGIGFDEKYVDRIFNLFQRLHGQGKYQGTGIGLAICRKIVERHGGAITARSKPGQGTTFFVTLPLEQHPSS
jgi:PAS domain S-box-containing protein